MGLTDRIKATQRRKTIRWMVEQRNGQRIMAEAIKQSTDGGLLVHVKAEAAR